jgi:hypothetical protein
VSGGRCGSLAAASSPRAAHVVNRCSVTFQLGACVPAAPASQRAQLHTQNAACSTTTHLCLLAELLRAPERLRLDGRQRHTGASNQQPQHCPGGGGSCMAAPLACAADLLQCLLLRPEAFHGRLVLSTGHGVAARLSCSGVPSSDVPDRHQPALCGVRAARGWRAAVRHALQELEAPQDGLRGRAEARQCRRAAERLAVHVDAHGALAGRDQLRDVGDQPRWEHACVHGPCVHMCAHGLGHDHTNGCVHACTAAVGRCM